MTKKDESTDTMNAPSAAVCDGNPARARLLASVAGHVASGLVSEPSPEMTDADKVAMVAVDIAEAILRRVGL